MISIRVEAVSELKKMINEVHNINDYYTLVDSRKFKRSEREHPLKTLKNKLNPGNNDYSGHDLVGRFRTSCVSHMKKLLGSEVGNPDAKVNPRKTQMWDRSVPKWKEEMLDWVEKKIVVKTELESLALSSEFDIVTSSNENIDFAQEILSELNEGDKFKPISYDDEDLESINVMVKNIFTIDLSING